ncbi:MAG: hypothetical protein DRI73_11750 [Bacteroidetes bacterium]|nr:MAG: hypothetical protein DRI73_11750 [Bacteroidota bacterium]
MSGKKVSIFILIIIVLAVLAYLAYRFTITPALHTGEFETAIVNRGSVIDFVPAQGVVQPGSEVLLLSPEASIIKEIISEPGSHVEAGEAIMKLDPDPILNQIESIKDQLQMKENSLQKTILNARSIRVDIEYNVEVKKLKITSLKSELADQGQLLEVGGISPAKVEQTKQQLVLAEKDLENILEKNSIRLEQLNTDLEGLKLQIKIQQKELDSKENLLKRMVIRAPSAGIILQVHGKKGERVNNHKLLVRMSDLSAYKIAGSIEDKFAGIIETGKTIYVIIGNERLDGQVGNISPEVINNKIEFDVFLKQNNHSKLIPNMSLELMVVNAQKDSILRIKSGPALSNDEEIDVYFIKSNIAKRRKITTGLMGSEYIEIISGAREGDKIIISEIPLFRNIEEIEIQ